MSFHFPTATIPVGTMPLGGGSTSGSSTAATGGLTETQKALVEDDRTQSLEQQETMEIKGSDQRHMIMQKLMRKQSEVGCLFAVLLDLSQASYVAQVTSSPAFSSFYVFRFLDVPFEPSLHVILKSS